MITFAGHNVELNTPTRLSFELHMIRKRGGHCSLYHSFDCVRIDLPYASAWESSETT